MAYCVGGFCDVRYLNESVHCDDDGNNCTAGSCVPGEGWCKEFPLDVCPPVACEIDDDCEIAIEDGNPCTDEICDPIEKFCARVNVTDRIQPCDVDNVTAECWVGYCGYGTGACETMATPDSTSVAASTRALSTTCWA